MSTTQNITATDKATGEVLGHFMTSNLKADARELAKWSIRLARRFRLPVTQVALLGVL